MKKKQYDKPMTKVVQLQHQGHILSVSNYTISSKLQRMDNDENLDVPAQRDKTGLWSMGADEDL